MSLLGLALGVGVILILESGIGEVGRPKIGMLLPGIMLLTVAAIFLFGVVMAWRGFEKRFGRESLLGYWEVAGDDWQKHLAVEKGKLVKRGLIVGFGMPGMELAVMLTLAASDGDLAGVAPAACIVSAAIAGVVGAVVFFQWYALSGNQGCVWLAKRGVLVNRVVFFIDGFGMETLARELKTDDGESHLSIRYRVRVRHGTVDKELVVPVPEEQVALVKMALKKWDSPAV